MKQTEEKKKLFASLKFPVGFLILIWGIFAVEYYSGLDFGRWGVLPRTFEGLKGILFYPLVHGDIKHLVNNSVPVLLLSTGIFYFYKEVAFRVFFWTYFMSGLWLWAAARPSYHIGASGLVYGFGSFIFFSGAIRKNKHLLALALLVVFEYGSMVWGIFPMKERISWEGHLYGALAGLILALYYREDGPQRERYSWELEEEEENEATNDILEKPNDQLRISYHYKPSNENTENDS